MGLVSVVIPHFNGLGFLDDAVDSALQQACEVVVVDDGSTQRGVSDYLDRVADLGVRVVHQASRGGAAARNVGVAQATGDYIVPLDADDRLQPTACETVASILDKDLSIGVVCWAQRLFGESDGVRRCEYTGSESMLYGTTIPNTCAYRKLHWEATLGYPEDIRVGGGLGVFHAPASSRWRGKGSR